MFIPLLVNVLSTARPLFPPLPPPIPSPQPRAEYCTAFVSPTPTPHPLTPAMFTPLFVNVLSTARPLFPPPPPPPHPLTPAMFTPLLVNVLSTTRPLFPPPPPQPCSPPSWSTCWVLHGLCPSLRPSYGRHCHCKPRFPAPVLQALRWLVTSLTHCKPLQWHTASAPVLQTLQWLVMPLTHCISTSPPNSAVTGYPSNTLQASPFLHWLCPPPSSAVTGYTSDTLQTSAVTGYAAERGLVTPLKGNSSVYQS